MSSFGGRNKDKKGGGSKICAPSILQDSMVEGRTRPEDARLMLAGELTKRKASVRAPPIMPGKKDMAQMVSTGCGTGTDLEGEQGGLRLVKGAYMRDEATEVEGLGAKAEGTRDTTTKEMGETRCGIEVNKERADTDEAEGGGRRAEKRRRVRVRKLYGKGCLTWASQSRWERI